MKVLKIIRFFWWKLMNSCGTEELDPQTFFSWEFSLPIPFPSLGKFLQREFLLGIRVSFNLSLKDKYNDMHRNVQHPRTLKRVWEAHRDWNCYGSGASQNLPTWKLWVGERGSLPFPKQKLNQKAYLARARGSRRV